MSFDLGDPVPLTVETRDANRILANAGAITLTITLPDRTTVSPSLTNPSPGRYELDYPTVQVGHHSVRVQATGVNSSAYADSFDVLPANPGYIVSLARAKRKLKIPLSDTEHDEDIRDYIESATSVIERHRKETVIQRTITEEQWAWRAYSLALTHTPAVSLVSVQTVDGVMSWDVSGLHLDGDTGIVSVKIGPLLVGHLQFVYVAGRAVIPAHFQRAALIIIEHLWQTERAQSQAGPFPGAYDDSMDGLRRMGTGFAIPNRALELLGPPPPMVG